MSNKKLSKDFLLDLFKCCLDKQHIFETVRQHMKVNYLYTDDYRYIWESMNKLYDDIGTIPRLSSIVQNLTENNKKEKYSQAIDLCKAIKAIRIENYDEILRGLEEFLKQSFFVEMYDTLGTEYNKGNKEQAYTLFKEKYESFSNFSLKSAKFDNIFNGFQKRLTQRMLDNAGRKEIQLPFGIDPIDDDTEGGAWTGETELWLGDSGVGKSKLLVTRGVNIARRGFRVLHVQAEGTRQQCLDNYDACWTGMNYSDVKKGDFKDEKLDKYFKVAKSISNQAKGDIHVYSAEQFDSITIVDVRNLAIDIIKQYGELHAIVLDYFELFGLGDGKKYDYEGGETRRQEVLARKLKNLAVELNVLSITATQSHSIPPEMLNDPKFVMTRWNLGKAKRKVEPFSYFLTINQTRDEKTEGLVRIYEDKFREHSAQNIHTIAQSLRNSRFYDRKRTIEINGDME